MDPQRKSRQAGLPIASGSVFPGVAGATGRASVAAPGLDVVAPDPRRIRRA